MARAGLEGESRRLAHARTLAAALLDVAANELLGLSGGAVACACSNCCSVESIAVFAGIPLCSVGLYRRPREEVTEPVQARGFGTEPGAAAYRCNKLASPIWRRLATASCIWTSVRVLDRAIAAYEASMALAASLNSLKASGCRE